MNSRIFHPFGPLVSPQSRTLILGSFPSVKSREQQFFYGHPQNRFWKMLAGVFETDVPLTVQEKQDLVLSHHLALWDTVGSCTITGSSDASVRNVIPVDIGQVLSVAKISQVLCNGALSGKLYHRYLESTVGLKAQVLPSTSPANASFSLNQLIEIWKPFLLQKAANNEETYA